MSQTKVGVDLDGESARVVSVHTGATGETFLLRSVPIGDWRSAIGANESRVTIAIDDRSSNVRIVRPAIVDPALAREAAEYEARIAMLGQDPEMRIDVTHIGNSNDPRAWLAVSTHLQVSVANRVDISGNEDTSTLYLPRSVALGRGYLFSCDTQAAGAPILIEAGHASSSICFLNGRAVVGTAQLKGLHPDARDTEFSAWFSELRMVVQYRLSTDLSSTDAGDASFIWVGNPGFAEKLSTIAGLRISPAKLRDVAISPDSQVPALTTDWLAALGAALN